MINFIMAMNNIKLLIFDLDGVLVDSRNIHFHALNMSLSQIHPDLVISKDEHLCRYDGLPTTQKLQILTKEKQLDPLHYEKIWKNKQKYTLECITEQITIDERLISIFKSLKAQQYLIYCASNAVWKTVQLILTQKGIINYFDWFISNEDVVHGKPAPDMYFRCIERAKCSVSETLIFEDSPVGRMGAYASGAHVCAIINPNDVTLSKIENAVQDANTKNSRLIRDLRWKSPINSVIPMAGMGSRFATKGYDRPKPLILVNGTPMIELVVRNINMDGHYIFIVQKLHQEQYNVSETLKRIAPGCDIVITDGVTEGAACSVLLARHLIDNDTPLLIANSDQYLEWDCNDFMYCASSEGVDGCISTFFSDEDKWSYAKTDSYGNVIRVEEKNVISTHATTGIYYWKRGQDFVHYADQMIYKNIRVKNEFYTCPVYNEAIQDQKKIKIKDCKRMWGIGVPEDLQFFLDHYGKDV